MADPALAAVYALSDRLKKTPAEIRRDISVDDAIYFLARDALSHEQR